MELPFSANQIKEILGIDTGFKNFLNSMPDAQKDQIKEILLDESILINALKSLPDQHRDQTLHFLKDIINTPEKAKRLYEQCRFFEARDLLLKTIDLYSNPPSAFSDFLNKATEFVTKRLKALCFNLLGDVEWVLGNSTKAGQYHQLALELAKEAGDLDTTVKAMQGLGTYHLEMGDFQKGMEYCQKAMELISGQEDRWGLGQKILTTLSVLSSDTDKNLDAALEYALKAVDLCAQKNDNKTLPVCLNNLACLYLEAEELDPAIEALEDALEIVHRENDLRHKALILNNLAMCILRDASSGEHIEWAASLINKALSISNDIGSFSLQALSIGNMGFVYQLSDRANEARKAFMDAVKIQRQIGSKSGEAAALINLGWHLKEYLGDFEGACQSCRKAIELVEDIRGGLKKEAHRINYAEKVTDPYQLVVDCLVNLNRADEAVEYVERSKSRALLDLLAGNLIDRISVESDPESFYRAAVLLGEIDEIQKNLVAIYQKEQEDNGKDNERAIRHEYDILSKSLLDELSEKERTFDEAFSELLELDPEKASILKESALPTNQIQELIDDDALFLELYQTEEKLQLFIISHDGPVNAVTVDIPYYKAVESVWNLMTGLRQKASLDIRSHEFIREVRQPLANFFELLITPLRPFMDRCQRLIISPHLFWHYLPFQALYDREKNVYLCDEIEIGYCPSASVLQLCHTKNRTHRDHALILSRNNGDLPHVDQEADLLDGAFYPNGHVFKGEQAHLGLISKGKNRYDVVHLACHGQFNPEQPFLSVLDIPPAESEDRQTYLLDFFRLRLDCNLVTLSACDSGLSQFTLADELIGLSRGLFYAGAASVLLSLWQVSDESTCYFMENFYWHFVKNHQSKTHSLQLAMQAVKAKEEYAHPYYWAPFVVMGDWR